MGTQSQRAPAVPPAAGAGNEQRDVRTVPAACGCRAGLLSSESFECRPALSAAGHPPNGQGLRDFRLSHRALDIPGK